MVARTARAVWAEYRATIGRGLDLEAAVERALYGAVIEGAKARRDADRLAEWRADWASAPETSCHGDSGVR